MNKRWVVLFCVVIIVLLGAVWIKQMPADVDSIAGKKNAQHVRVGGQPIDPAAVRAEIQRALEAGKLTPEQAQAKLEWLEKVAAREELTEEQVKIQDAVASGWEKFRQNNPSTGGSNIGKEREKPFDPDTVRAQIQHALEEGKLTRAQAEAKLQWLEEAEAKKTK